MRARLIDLPRASRPLRGRLVVPPDKSISHRALLFGALAEGVTRATNLLLSQDTRSTIAALRGWGCAVELEELAHGRGRARVEGRTRRPGVARFRPPAGPLDCGNSGTTLRLGAGLAATQPFLTELIGDDSLSRRPMNRILRPLAAMGARASGVGGRPPLRVGGPVERPLEGDVEVRSAQVKSCLLLAGLALEDRTVLHQAAPCRDHSERLLAAMGADLRLDGAHLVLVPGRPLEPLSIDVPGDVSSAAFWLAAAATIPGSELSIDDVGLNPSRTAFLRALDAMGAAVEVRADPGEQSVEPRGRIRIEGGDLVGASFGPGEVEDMIDEVPLIAVLGLAARGVTEVRGANELRVKESDRIDAIVRGLRDLGCRIDELPDGFRLEGPQVPRGGLCEAAGDHRIAMGLAIAALRAAGPARLAGGQCVSVSYPGFFRDLDELVGPA